MTKNEAFDLIGEMIQSKTTPEELWPDCDNKLRMIRGALTDGEFDKIMTEIVMPRRIAQYLKASLSYLKGRDNSRDLMRKVADEIDSTLGEILK